MARPQSLQMLRHGKMLVQSTFPQFVDTWNYSINRLENIKGDADTNPDQGYIKVDNTDPEHPVIRLVNTELSNGGGGGGGGMTDGYPEPWFLDMANDKIRYPFFQVGTYRSMASVDSISLSDINESETTKTIYCNIDMSQLTAEASYTPINDWSHFSVEVFQLSCLSAGTGEIDEETGKEISALTRDYYYKCRYPTAPVWEQYTI